MKALNQRDPFRLGLVALLVGGLLAGAVVVISVIPFGEKSYTAILAQTAGLRVGESVDVAGVPAHVRTRCRPARAASLKRQPIA